MYDEKYIGDDILPSIPPKSRAPFHIQLPPGVTLSVIPFPRNKHYAFLMVFKYFVRLSIRKAEKTVDLIGDISSTKANDG